MFNLRHYEKVLLALVAAGLLGAIATGLERHAAEEADRRVAIVIDGREMLMLGAAAGVPAAQVAARLREAGATAVAVNEVTLDELVRRGEVIVEQEKEQMVFLGCATAETASALRGALARRLPGLRIEEAAVEGRLYFPKVMGGFSVEGDLTDMYEAGLFLDPAQTTAAQAANLEISARLMNSVFAQKGAIEYALAETKAAGARLIIFDKEEVLGYDGLIGYAAQEMRSRGLRYGWVELAAQYGEERLRQEMWDQMLRVHSVSEKEVAKFPRERILARFVRAVRERNIDVCYVHLFLRPQADLMGYNAAFVADLKAELQRAGFAVGEAEPARPVGARAWAMLLMGLGIAAGAALLAGRLLPLGAAGSMVFFAALAGLLFGAQFGLHKAILTRQVWSLLAGVAFPTLGLVLAWHKMNEGSDSDDTAAPAGGGTSKRLNVAAVLMAVGLTVEVAIFSLMGGLFVGGMLTDTRFMVGAEQFRGVKLLLVGPALVLAAAMICGLRGAFYKKTAWVRQVSASIAKFARDPLLVGPALLVVAALGAGGLLLLRSGNTAAGAAPGFERQVREFLEVTLWARPRTKEFLLGHPALLLAAIIWLKNRGRAIGLGPGEMRSAAVLLLVAALGQASMANTFCHLHTPLLFSLVRSLNGLWLGLAVGLTATVVWLAGARWWRRALEAGAGEPR